MPKAESDLALRKDLLLAQSAVYRAKLHYELISFRTRVPARASMLGMLLLLAGRARSASWIGTISKALFVVRMVRTVMGLFRRK